MTAASSGTQLPQRPAGHTHTEFPAERALGTARGEAPPWAPRTGARRYHSARAVLPNFRRLHEARLARGPARTSGRRPPGASFPAAERTPRTPNEPRRTSRSARPYLQTPFRPRRAAPARRREPRAPPGSAAAAVPGRSAARSASPPPPLRRRSAQGRAGREERSGPGRGRRGGREQSAFVRRAGPRGRPRALRPTPPSPEPPPHSRASPGSSGAALLTRPGPAAPPPAPARRPPASPQSPPPQPPPCNPARRAGGGGDGGGSTSAGRGRARGVSEGGGPGLWSRSRRSSRGPGGGPGSLRDGLAGTGPSAAAALPSEARGRRRRPVGTANAPSSS